ncbi:deoxyribose-phosphate aldolase [Aedoeadaptatus nemausensis]|uniref:Deoxyribose-phosphate aldolase n=1 Tax=Aedoeadaptatus nemausensis TaxID=2582829 RepID=A0A6V6XZ49_9FIRM|nr:deoxyribose-phosphate aldolase [Peptoniphilus nemausensis]CAC9924552.1 deoxyribose-phosphate aldolase [Peptoniphilus nemausensis]
MKLNKTIDHTILQADATKDLVIKTIDEAKAYDTASICLEPCWVELAAERLKGSDVKVCTVIGFPLGATTSATKAFEAKEAVANGADEVDMVLNIGALKSGDEEMVLKDMKAVREAVPSAVVKVIIETCLLTDQEKKTACRLAKEARLDFVKTSTGFSTGGATVEDVRLMREAVGEEMGVKASGGIRTKETAEAMIEAGATRIGASKTAAILGE